MNSWLFRVIGLTLSLLGISGASLAQDNPLPQGRVTLVIGFAPGGPVDAVCRLLAEKIGPRINRTVVPENRGGAGGNVAAAAVAKSDPDGLTWLTALDTAFTVNPYIFKSPGFSNDALSPIALVGVSEQMLAINAALPISTVADLVAYAKSNPVVFASGGNGTSGHLSFEYLKLVTGMKASHVPYRGAAPAANDLLAGHVQAAFITSSALLPHVRSGKLKALAVSSPARIPAAPDIPTAKEAGITDFEALFAFVMQVPASTPPAVQAFIGQHVAAVFEQSEFRERLQVIGVNPKSSTPAEARAWLARETERWSKVIKATGMKVD